MVTRSGRPLCIIGNVLLESGKEGVRTIWVEDGIITQILEGKQECQPTPDVIRIELKTDEVLLPGFINLHVHSEYNIFPFWQSPATWSNRFQWRNNGQYVREIQQFKDYIEDNWKQDEQAFKGQLFKLLLADRSAALTEATLFEASQEAKKMHGVVTELQAVAGGTTLVQQTIRLDEEGATLPNFIIRDTGDPAELGIPTSKSILSAVDFVKPNISGIGDPAHAQDDTSNWPLTVHSNFNKFIASVQAGNTTYYATITHLAEGRSGYLQQTPDGFSRKEFTEFHKLLSGLPNPTALNKSNLTLTHACGLDFSDKSTIEFLKQHNISVIWSPVSNLLLYKDTLPIHLLLEQGINVCLGSDWAPSGSKHVWDELKFAFHFCKKLKLNVNNMQLLQMVTQNPATALGGIKTGSVKEGYYADFFVLRKQSVNQTALEALLTQNDDSVRCTIVNGRVVYGDEDLFQHDLFVDYQRIPRGEGDAASRKVVSINSMLQFNLEKALTFVDLLINRYATETLKQPNFKRTSLLSSDDRIYQAHIRRLKNELAKLYSWYRNNKNL